MAIASLPLDASKHFSAARRQIRELLDAGEVGQQIEGKVRALLGLAAR